MLRRVDDFKGTSATVGHALEGTFETLPAGEAAWRCAVGPARVPVAVHITGGGGQPVVTLASTVTAAPTLDGRLAQAIAREHDGLLFGRFRHDGGAIVVEQAILGGHTLNAREVQIAAWAVGWAAAAYRPRWERHLAGEALGGDLPVPQVEARRGIADRIESTTSRVEAALAARYGAFQHDPHWGYHGPFGSARVFVNVRHTLEVSTAILVASPILSAVALTDALALDVHAAAAASAFGRFAYAADRSELWVEHAILGDDLDPVELETAIDAVARLSDGEDDRLQAAHGGSRYADLTGG
jgi:hypothetical protein